MVAGQVRAAVAFGDDGLDRADLAESVTALKDRLDRTLVAVGAGELATALIVASLADEFWFWVSPSLWPSRPRIFDGVGPIRLELIGSTTFAPAWCG